MNALARGRLLLAALWVGSLWTVGYLVAPILFATLADRALAGTIAGSMFRAEAWLSLVCMLAMLSMLIPKHLQAVPNRKAMLLLVLGMGLCTLVGYFCLQPFMAAIRQIAGASGGMPPDLMLRFGLLHGAASGIYFVQSALGVALLLKLRY